MNETANHTHAAHQEHGTRTTNPTEFWEERYSSAAAVWSGRVNRSLADLATAWKPGRSLDLGCGEGGDVIWLAERGWDAFGIDLSPTAVARGAVRAQELGLHRARFAARDLGEWATGKNDSVEMIVPGTAVPEMTAPEGSVPDSALPTYDLVTACFLQSPVDLPRAEILWAAAARVAPGGRLVVISHAAPPPWAKGYGGEFLTPAGELALLDLPPREWVTELAEVRSREATSPDGVHATLEDSVVVVRRGAGSGAGTSGGSGSGSGADAGGARGAGDAGYAGGAADPE